MKDVVEQINASGEQITGDFIPGLESRSWFVFFCFLDFIYLTENEHTSRESLWVREKEKQREGGRGRSRLPAEWGTQHGAQTQDPGVMT